MDKTITYEQIIAQRLGAMEQAKRDVLTREKAKAWLKVCAYFDMYV